MVNPTMPVEELQKTITIHIATTQEEREEIYRLRYQVYAEEMSYPLTYADHRNKRLYDELDSWGILIYARVNSEIVGTMMINIGFSSEFPGHLAEELGLHKVQQFKVAYISKGMITPAYRNTPVFNLLSEKSYQIYCENQVQFSFGICNFYLLPLHEHFGYRRYGRTSVDPSYGTIVKIVLLPDDLEHLRAVGSRFYQLACKRKNLDARAKIWFQTEFPEAAEVINSQLVTENQLWDYISLRLGDFPNAAIPMLHNLSEQEAKVFLHRCSVIVQCHKNSYAVICDSVSQEINILLSGRLNNVTVPEPDVKDVLPGEHFGAIGLINRDRHAVTMIAGTFTEILVVSRHLFQKFSHAYAETANKIFQNLARYGGTETRENTKKIAIEKRIV